MIVNESQEYKTFYIHRDNWKDNGGAISFNYKRNAGNVRMSKPINIPKSQLKMNSLNSSGITEFQIKTWILNKKLSTGYSLIEW